MTSNSASRPPVVAWHDVQALVRTGFSTLNYSVFLPFRFADAGDGDIRRWLEALALRVTRAEAPAASHAESLARRQRTNTHTLNVMFSALGVSRIFNAGAAPTTFPVAFREGMAPQPGADRRLPRRSICLGDTDTNDPGLWRWRDTGSYAGRIDGMLLIYAETRDLLEAQQRLETRRLTDCGLRLLSRGDDEGPLVLSGRRVDDLYEPFGFRDGVSQPIIDSDRKDKRAGADTPALTELGKRALEQSVVRTGELLLGYTNERGVIAGQIGDTAAPYLKNGTYVVLRELHQDVPAFENYVRKAASAHFGTATPERIEWIKERMMGRGTDGAMLTATNDVPGGVARTIANATPNQDTLDNDALYHPSDRFGFACPLGSHVRRANPRDSLGPEPGTALRLVKMHRIVRRSRLIDQGSARGLYFMALNADISGQFEHIQQNWINNDRFMGLNGEIDPISHYRPVADTDMTIQRRPFNVRLERIPQFVTVRGGGYFFLPSLTALGIFARTVTGGR